MKRFHALWLCLCLLLPLMAAGLAPATQDGMISLPDNEYRIQSAAMHEGALYLAASQGIYRWAPGEASPSKAFDLSEHGPLLWQNQAPQEAEQLALWQTAVRWVVSDGKALLAMQPYTLQVFELAEGKLSPAYQLPLDALLYDDQPPEIRQIAFQEGKLWLLLGSDYGGEGAFSGLVSYDPATQALSKLDLGLVQSITSGPKGQLLLWLRPEDSDKPERAGLFVYDTQASALGAKLLPFDQKTTGFAWDEAGQRLLYWRAGQLMALDAQGQTSELNYLAMDGAFPRTEAFALPGQGYALIQGGSIVCRDASGQGMKGKVVLRTLGIYGATTALKYMALHPEVVIHSAGEGDSEGVLASLTARQDDVDIYETATLSTFQAAVQKGYARPLDSQALQDKAARLLQPLQELVQPEGKLYGMPVSLQPQLWTINLNKWEELNLGERPSTLLEAFEQSKRWYENFAEDNPEHSYFSPWQDFGFYVDFAVSSYILSHAKEDEPLRFDTPVFRQTLKDLAIGKEALTLDAQQEQLAQGAMYELLMTYSPGGIGETGMDQQTAESILPLAITAGEPRVYSGDVSLIFLHANTKHADIAQDYINFHLEQLHATEQALLYPDMAQPRRSPDFERLMAEQQARIDELKAAIAKAEASEKRALEDKLVEEEARLARYDRNLWEISPRSIELQKALLPQLRFPGPHAASLYAQRYQSLSPIIQRYAQGQLPEEQFIGELEGVARLIYLEAK